MAAAQQRLTEKERFNELFACSGHLVGISYKIPIIDCMKGISLEHHPYNSVSEKSITEKKGVSHFGGNYLFPIR